MTVRLNAAPAVCVVGVPVLPAELPGTAVSPGARRSSFAKAAAPTVIEPLVPVFDEPATLTDWVPAALIVASAVRVFVP